jgi:hypothetical protein
VDKARENRCFAGGLFSQEYDFDLGFYLGEGRLGLLLLHLKL